VRLGIYHSPSSAGSHFGKGTFAGDMAVKTGVFNPADGIIGCETAKIITRNGFMFRKIRCEKV
jgi:hypothetical protein